MAVYNNDVGYYIPMNVIVALFLTISLKLPDSNTSSTKRKITLFPIYRSPSHSLHPCEHWHCSEDRGKDKDYF